MALTTALGLMSGTSMDGIDLAVVRTDGREIVERGPSGFVAYEAPFRHAIAASLEDAKAIVRRDERPGRLGDVERAVTERHAVAVRDFLRGLGPAWQPSLVGFHGQTVLHRPAEGLTVQLGDGQALADAVGLPVVWDMRAQDMRQGGQGAPLVPAYHAALARGLPAPFDALQPVVFVNIGGISNITFVPATGDPVAFDTGPGNALLDQWVALHAGIPFDDGGRIASEGGFSRSIVDRYLAKPFFARPGPKSLDRGDFTLAEMVGVELADGARTLAAVSAEAIALSLRHLPQEPLLWIVCGGGRRNPFIVADLAAAVQPSRVIVAEDAGLAGDATEAEAWAYLAVRARAALPLTYPGTTGCRRPTGGGIVSIPLAG